MAGAMPFMKFYTSDWRAEPRLRNCTIAARGLWMEMLCLMHEADHRGYLVVNDKPMTDEQLSVQTGVPLALLPDLVRELEEQVVFSRTRTGVIYSRRMVRDAKKSRVARKNGRNGGNPTLVKQRRNPASDNQQDKPGDKLRSQKPEARDITGELSATPSRGKPPPSPIADLAMRVRNAAGITSPVNDVPHLEAMLAEGIPAAFIVEQAAAIGAREAAKRKSIGSFKYLAGPIREAHQAAAAHQHSDVARYDKIVADYGPNPSIAPPRKVAGGTSR